MELSSISKFFTSIILIGSVIACKEDSDQSNASSDIQEEAQKEVIAPPEPQNEILECSEAAPSIQVMSIASTPDVSGSDGDYYLASGEVAVLEDREYNFNNIYLESNSTINISEQAKTDSAFIKINALGSCDLNGLVNIIDFKGTLQIHCDGQFNSGGELRVSGNRVLLLANGMVITATQPNSEDEGEEGSSAAISNGDDLIDFELPQIVTIDLVNGGYDFPGIIVKEGISNSEQILHTETTIFYPCLNEN